MKIPRSILALAGVLVLAACDDTTTTPAGSVPLSLSVAVAPGIVPATSALGVGSTPARAETFDDGTNLLIIDRVAMVLEEVELERLFDDDCDLIEGDDDDCEEFEAGPFLLELPLDGSVEQVFGVNVPADSYKELEFEIEAPGDDDADQIAFLQANPTFEEVSIRVEGSWNGEPFVYTSNLEAEQELDLVPPLEVTEGSGPLNLTLTLDISGWFVDGSGKLVDPSTANKDGVNEELVEANIQASFEVFEDDDRDGDDDNDESD